MRVSRQSMTKRSLLCTLCFAVVAGYSWSSVSIYRAHLSASHPDEALINRSVALAPGDAEYHNLLCRSRLFSTKDPANALGECQKAADLNPYRSSIWLDLAHAYYLTGNIPFNDAAIHRAPSVDSSTPDTILNVANFLMIHNNVSAALKQFAIVLHKDPSFVPATLNTPWRSVNDVNRIQGMLPKTPAAYLEFVRILDAASEFDQAGQVWSSLMEMNGDFDYRQSLFYIDDLIQAGRSEQSYEAWRQLGERSQELHAYFQPGNLVINGSFAKEILNAGFDWRYNPNALVDLTLDSADTHAGGRSLRLTYSAADGNAGIFQYIAVHPHARYRMSAWVKSEDLEAANGPTLALLDAVSHMSVAYTQDTIGTTSWHPIEAELTTGPATNLLVLSIVRTSGKTAIWGKFWIDDIRMEPL